MRLPHFFAPNHRNLHKGDRTLNSRGLFPFSLAARLSIRLSMLAPAPPKTSCQIQETVVSLNA
jgi:hypothetical protein